MAHRFEVHTLFCRWPIFGDCIHFSFHLSRGIHAHTCTHEAGRECVKGGAWLACNDILGRKSRCIVGGNLEVRGICLLSTSKPVQTSPPPHYSTAPLKDSLKWFGRLNYCALEAPLEPRGSCSGIHGGQLEAPLEPRALLFWYPWRPCACACDCACMLTRAIMYPQAVCSFCTMAAHPRAYSMLCAPSELGRGRTCVINLVQALVAKHDVLDVGKRPKFGKDRRASKHLTMVHAAKHTRNTVRL